MRAFHLILVTGLSLFISCLNHSNNNSFYSLRDTVLEEYFRFADSSGQYDTTDFHYKILKAYKFNDTIFLKQIQGSIRRYPPFPFDDSCIHQKKLQDLKIDEGYRFIYTAAFCPYKLNTTITKYGDSFNLHFIIYQIVSDTSGCRILSEYDKRLSRKDWDEFLNAMDHADYWGLKNDNGKGGLDGSRLTVAGFNAGYRSMNGNPRSHFVYRWGFSTLDQPFTLVLKYSENNLGCLTVK